MNDQDRAEAFITRLVKGLPIDPNRDVSAYRKRSKPVVRDERREAAVQDYQNRLQRKQRGAQDYASIPNLHLTYPTMDYRHVVMGEKRRQRRQEQYINSRQRRNVYRAAEQGPYRDLMF